MWPGLSAVFYTRPDPAFDVRPIRDRIGESVLLLEVLTCFGSPVAIEDPVAGGLRLLTGHGSYYEFLPADASRSVDLRRLGIGEVTPGVPYELVLSSPAGVWGCRTGVTVVFDRLIPPVLRVIAAPRRVEPISPPRTAPATASLPRPRTADTAAALREIAARTPW
ncbi:MAG: GH3 auxin-responsive promoter family protein [Gemmataceae bacterium]